MAASKDRAARQVEIDAVLGLVRERGGRVTAARKALVETLFEVDGHATAEELVEQVHALDPDAHLSTVYRNLEELEELGVVSHSHLGHGAVTYQLASNSHAHVRCSSCGKTIDMPSSLFDDIVSRVKDKIGFVIESSHFSVEGVCRSCAAAAASKVARRARHA